MKNNRTMQNVKDKELMQTILDSFKWNTMIPDDQVTIAVDSGNVKLEGEVEWEYQRLQAKSSIEKLEGIRSIENLITVKPKFTPSEIQQKIYDAFQQSAGVDAGKITAEVSGSKVVLNGKVRSLAEKEDAEKAAWSVPGVRIIESNLQIEEPECDDEESEPDLFNDQTEH